jgi:hypothetical protein
MLKDTNRLPIDAHIDDSSSIGENDSNESDIVEISLLANTLPS